jgi:hypothetical protein
MGIVGGLDLHRNRITFDVLNTETGKIPPSRVCPADRESSRLAGLAGQQVELAVEDCTGWRFVIEEMSASASAGRPRW